jgi:membrane protein implicated in regulation of membrane protease activity
MISEIFTGAFYLIFFGLAAQIVAGLDFFMPQSLTAELLIFAALGTVLVLTIRKRIVAAVKERNGTFASDTTLIADTDVAKGATVTITYHGAPWTAINVGTSAIAKASKAIIVRIEGTKLHIRGYEER